MNAQARIPHLNPSYEPEVEALLREMMPRDSELAPLKLFRTFTVNQRLAQAMMGIGPYLLGRGSSLDARDREIVIDRTCARCGCEYEWGVHVAFFGQRVGLSEEELAATTESGVNPTWSPRDALLIQLVDELHDDAQVSDAAWAGLTEHWNDQQLLELLLLSGWYHAVAYVANGARVELEDWAPRFPTGNHSG